MLYVICYMLYVACYMLYVICCMLYVIFYMLLYCYILMCYMLYDTCYMLYDRCCLFCVFDPKMASQKSSKIVLFELPNRSIFGPKGGFKSEKLKDQKCASHGRQKQNRETCLSNEREAPYMYGYVNTLFKPDTTL